MRTVRGIVLAALAASAACVRRAPPADLSPDPAALLEQVARTQGAVARVRGEAKVKVDTADGGGSLTQFVVAERPDRVRLDAVDFFGNPVATLAAAGGRFALLDLKAGVFYRGRASPGNLARLVPFEVTAPELVLLLCGAAPIVEGRPAGVEPGDGVLRLTVEAADRVQRLDVGEGAAVHASAVRARGGGAPAGALDVAFDRFEPLGGRPFPMELRVDAPGAHASVRLRWKEIEANGVIPPGGWELAPPPGVRIVDLD
jgi:hypothetical protein